MVSGATGQVGLFVQSHVRVAFNTDLGFVTTQNLIMMDLIVSEVTKRIDLAISNNVHVQF